MRSEFLRDLSRVTVHCGGTFLAAANWHVYPMVSAVLGLAILIQYAQNVGMDQELRLLRNAVAQPEERRWFSIAHAVAWAESTDSNWVVKMCQRLSAAGVLESTVTADGFIQYAAPVVARNSDISTRELTS